MSVQSGVDRSSFFSHGIQMLISSKNILTDTPRNNVLPATWTFLSPVLLAHKTNHHNQPHPHPHHSLARLASREGTMNRKGA